MFEALHVDSGPERFIMPSSLQELEKERRRRMRAWERLLVDSRGNARERSQALRTVDKEIRQWIDEMINSGRYKGVFDLKPRSSDLEIGDIMIRLEDGSGFLIEEPKGYLNHKYDVSDLRPPLPMCLFIDPEAALELQQETYWMSDPRKLFLRAWKLSKPVPGAFPMQLDPIRLRISPIVSKDHIQLKPIEDFTKNPFYESPDEVSRHFHLSTNPILRTHPGQKSR